jgi:hypothetical protein
MLNSSINGYPGEFGCDLMSLYYDGDPENPAAAYVGWADQIASKASAILTIIGQGIMVLSAYETTITGDVNAYKSIQDDYSMDTPLANVQAWI